MNNLISAVVSVVSDAVVGGVFIAAAAAIFLVEALLGAEEADIPAFQAPSLVGLLLLM